MHELPSDLTNSLRSYRGSIYGSRRASRNRGPDDVDLEKGWEQPGRETERLFVQPQSPSAQQRGRMSFESSPQRDSGQHEFEKTDWAATQGDYRAPSPTRPAINTSRPTVRVRNDPPQTPATPKASVFQSAPVADPDPAASRLGDDYTPLTPDQFYELIGMLPPVNGNQQPRHLQSEHGLYGTVLKTLDKTQRKYVVFDVLAYGFLAVQLVLGALFIVIGALQQVNSHTTIAVLGALSTFLTGGLALMKGQGLPNRLRQTRDSLRNVVFAADELYVDFHAGRAIVFADVKRLREDYVRVMEEANRNHPDTWNAATNAIGNAASGKPGAAKS